MQAAVLTVSTSVSRRDAEDESGPLLAQRAEEAGAEVVAMEVVPDDLSLIEDRIRHYVDEPVELILTTGGTGVRPDEAHPGTTLMGYEARAAGASQAVTAAPLMSTAMTIHQVAGLGMPS